jgi:hypothetical protein
MRQKRRQRTVGIDDRFMSGLWTHPGKYAVRIRLNYATPTFVLQSNIIFFVRIVNTHNRMFDRLIRRDGLNNNTKRPKIIDVGGVDRHDQEECSN